MNTLEIDERVVHDLLRIRADYLRKLIKESEENKNLIGTHVYKAMLHEVNVITGTFALLPVRSDGTDLKEIAERIWAGVKSGEIKD